MKAESSSYHERANLAEPGLWLKSAIHNGERNERGNRKNSIGSLFVIEVLREKQNGFRSTIKAKLS